MNATRVAAERLAKPRRVGSNAFREAIEGYVWISPWIIGFLVFTLGPMIASFALSLTNYTGLKPPNWIGFENYGKVFAGDRLFYGSMGRTFYYALVSVPIGMIGSVLLAMLLNERVAFRALWRTLYYLPSLTPTVAMTILWLWILQPQFGLVNYLLWLVGIQGPAWFGSRQWAIPSLIIMGLWSSLGGSRMIIFLAALQGVPEELYEAAKIDGANAIQRFFSVTLPMISPAFLFNLVLGIISALKVFETAFIATQGGPAYATWFLALHVYTQAFQYSMFGYASAVAWIFFIVVLALTAIQLKVSGRWVYYEAEVG